MRVFRLIIIVLCFTACGKSTQVQGTVYSKHHIPVPNARITLQIFTTASSYPTTTQSKTGTDEFGHYSFEFKANTLFKKYQYKVDCSAADSGHTYERHIEKGSANHIDFNLE